MTSILHTTDRDDTFCLFHIPLASFLPSLPLFYFVTKKSIVYKQPNKQTSGIPSVLHIRGSRRLFVKRIPARYLLAFLPIPTHSSRFL